MNWNGSSNGFPPEEAMASDVGEAWERLHAAVVEQLVAHEEHARRREAIRRSTAGELFLAFTKNDLDETVELDRRLCTREVNDALELEVAIGSEELAAALNALQDEAREAIARFLVWGFLREEYKKHYPDDEAQTDDGVEEEDEEDSWENSNDFPWEDGMGFDDESWRDDEHPSQEDDEDRGLEFDPHLLQLVINSVQNLESIYRAIVERRVHPDDSQRISQQ